MADVVQYRLERMVSELDDLERRGLFTRREIAEVVKARRKFEYRLKRPSPMKQDFLDYIEYEKQLDRLRVLRKKAVSRELKATDNKKMKKSVSDFAAVRRIIEIYRMATSRFKGDLQLWFQYLEFCKERKNGRMKKVLAQVMRFHPKVPAVWVYAAAWEFDHNLNAEAARAIMQSGLRACSTSEDLWVEYLRMELTYLNKLKMRKVILGEDDGTLVRDNTDAEEKQWQEENEELFMSLEEKEGASSLDVQSKDASRKLDLFQEHGFSILRTVYKSAIDAHPSSFTLRKKFLEIVEATDLAHSEEMLNEIVADMRKDFSQEPDYWDWLARLKLNDPQSTLDISSESGRYQVDEVTKVYEEAIRILPSIAMFNRYIKFLMNVIIPKGEEMQSFGPSASTNATEYVSHLLMVFGKAESMGCLDDDLACQHVKFYLYMGNFYEAMKIAENFCEGRFSGAIQLWVLRVTEHMKLVQKSTNPSKADLSSVFGLLEKMVKKVAISNVESLWVMALELFTVDRKYFNKLLDLSLSSLAKDGGSDDGFSLPVTFISFMCKKHGIQQARDLYKRFITLPHPGLAMYKHCIELEISIGDEYSLANARKLFESALMTYSQDISLWQEYFSMETKMGTSETANAVYWRAKKTLGDASAIAVPAA